MIKKSLKTKKIGKLVLSAKWLRKIADAIETEIGKGKEKQYECFVVNFGDFRGIKDYKTLVVKVWPIDSSKRRKDKTKKEKRILKGYQPKGNANSAEFEPPKGGSGLVV